MSKLDGAIALRDRRQFIGGSAARVIMGKDEKALGRLWRGETAPLDLSKELIRDSGLINLTTTLVHASRGHHRELHRAGKEVDWWTRNGIEPVELAGRLWFETHPQGMSASPPQGNGAATEAKRATGENAAAVIANRPATETTKRTQLPGAHA